MWDTRQLIQLGDDLGKLPTKVTRAVTDLVDESGEDLRKAWVANATETAGEHGKHYPSTITTTPKTVGIGTIAVEVGPSRANGKQGGMGKGFEYGSANQPPHMDGNRAADLEVPRFQGRLSTALTMLLRDL